MSPFRRLFHAAHGRVLGVAGLIPRTRFRKKEPEDDELAVCHVCGDLDRTQWGWRKGPKRGIMMGDLSKSALSCAACAALQKALLANMEPEAVRMIHYFDVYTRGASSALLNYFSEDLSGVELFAPKDIPSPWPAIGHARALTKPFTRESAQLAKEWLQECLDQHIPCQQCDTPLPTRVLAVNSAIENGEPFLYETKNENAPYVALSHCWGDPKYRPLITTTENIHLHTATIPLATMPPTFLDAILLTRDLGIEYLWIDSLCILQDDKDDWARESGHMTDVYQNAILTISADGAANCREGLFSPVGNRRFPPEVQIDVPKRADGNVQSSLYSRLTSLNDMGSRVHTIEKSENQPLRDRAWALQEWLLSSRIVHFTRGEMLWECKVHQCCECQVGSQPIAELYDMGLSRSTFYRRNRNRETEQTIQLLWPDVVTAFTSRQLTYESDKLPAISGLARLCWKNFDGSYVAGLWKSELLSQLLWYTRGDGFCKRHQTYIAPSWSWASITGPVKCYEFRGDNTLPYRCEILDSGHVLRTSNLYGEVSSAFIKIRALLAKLPNVIQGATNMITFSEEKLGHLGIESLEILLDSHEVPLEVGSSDTISFLILWRTSDRRHFGIDQLSGLALKCIDQESRTFMRVGKVTLTYRKPKRSFKLKLRGEGVRKYENDWLKSSYLHHGDIMHDGDIYDECWDTWLVDVLKASEETVTLV